MYQFYYSEKAVTAPPEYQKTVWEECRISAIRPTMWEEHCLECAAPLCFGNCANYKRRADGRCKRFNDGIQVYPNQRGCCGQAARVKFRKWGNMMTIVFPAILPVEEYQTLTDKNQKLGNLLKTIVEAPAPVKLRWESIRTMEYIRRRKLRRTAPTSLTPDTFIFHGFSFADKPFRLILEVYKRQEPVYKTSLLLEPGENLIRLDRSKLSDECWKPNNLIKIYPENNLEVEIEILWCDFVCGESVQKEAPAEKVKCLVWDLDNTLWDGTLIETDDPKTLKLKPGVEKLIKTLDGRGILQSIASKNDFEAAWPILEELNLAEYFLYPQIHWGAKSGSLEQIAKQLNIGVNSLALVDDSPFERKQVNAQLPCVRCYQDTEIESLDAYPEFQVLVTAESKNRRAMYRAEEKRNELKVNQQDTISFLRQCHLKARLFKPETDEEILRCYELSSRTNQLNMSGKKYTQEEFSVLIKDPEKKTFAFSCSDDFGEYGIVGFGQYRVQTDTLAVTEFAMSCRVAGKYVESALFAGLLNSENCGKGTMTVLKTKKNSLLRDTLKDIGFKIKIEDNNRIEYSFSPELLNEDLVEVENANER